jgi:hypothetical protein
MNESITVYVNGKPVSIYRGMKVRHALLSFDYDLYKAVLSGRVIVKDENGFALGLEGALNKGAKIFAIEEK